MAGERINSFIFIFLKKGKKMQEKKKKTKLNIIKFFNSFYFIFSNLIKERRRNNQSDRYYCYYIHTQQCVLLHSASAVGPFGYIKFFYIFVFLNLSNRPFFLLPRNLNLFPDFCPIKRVQYQLPTVNQQPGTFFFFVKYYGPRGQNTLGYNK